MERYFRGAAEEFKVPESILREIVKLEKSRTHLLERVRKKDLAPKIRSIIVRHMRKL